MTNGLVFIIVVRRVRVDISGISLRMAFIRAEEVFRQLLCEVGDRGVVEKVDGPIVYILRQIA